MSSRVICSCGWSWNKSDSSKKDMYVCHQCGKDNTMKDGGWLSKYNDIPEAQNGIEGTMGGLTDKGFNYNGAWGGTMAMGGSLPGSVGFTYARTQSPAPSNGKYAKKTKASAQNGQEMKFYQEGLDWKPKSISRDGGWLSKYEGGGIIEDDMGQWAHPGEITKINSNQITMQGVNYPVLGISDTGDTQMMYPNQDYTYDGESVTEIPMMQPGGKVKFGQKQKPDPFYNPLEYYQYTGKPIKQPWMPGDEKIKISDKRTMNAAANSAIRPNKDLVGGKYDADRISNIASVAKLYGIDPNLLLSIDLQETGFGTIGEDPGSESIGHTKGYNLSDLKTPSKRGSDEDVFDDRYDFFARAYLEKMAEGKRQGLTDSLDIIQNYNGRGIITPKTENKYHGFDMKEIYGVPLPTKGISMKQNPLYGKRIFDLRENVIKQNPDLQRLINLAKPTNKPVIEQSQMFQMPASNKKENGGWLNKYEMN